MGHARCLGSRLGSSGTALVHHLSRRQRQAVLCLAGASRDAVRSSSRRSPGIPSSLSALEKITSLTGGPAVAVPAPAVPLEQELQGLSPLEAQKRLTGRVKTARTLQDFGAVVNAGGRLIDAICLVAILSGLPRSVQRAAVPVLVPSSPSPPSTSGASIAGTARSQMQLSEADTAELGSLVARLLELVSLRLREFDSLGLVTVAVGLAKLSAYTPVPASAFRSLLAAVEPRLPGLGTKALANLMWALASAGVQPCGAWLSHFYAAVERQVDSFSGGDLANLMWGLAKFDLMPEVWLVDQVVAASLAQLQRSHSAADGATVLTCLARYYCSYNFRLPDEGLAAFLAALQPGLRSASPGDLVAIVHSAVCMSHMPSRAFMLDLYAVLKDRLAADPTLSHADFSRLLWSLSRVDSTPPRSWLREFVEVSAPKLPHLRPRALSELMWALACWDARPSPRFLSEFYRASSRRVALGEYVPAAIGDTLSALAKMGCRAPAPWLGGMLGAFCGALPEAASHELVAVLESVVEIIDDQDRPWLAAPAQRRALQRIADTAASKFAAYDACAHARLVLALARANCCPGSAWLNQQQASLASAWSSGGADIDSATAADLRQAYSQWEVQLDTGLAAELGLGAAGAGAEGQRPAQ
ncbi:hypothetical protein HYH03_006811 [Edaphochlamys debaryana]|uniref:Uncharacterized protein n=1 Tax=Edaphochlamys debaryana TaxID=47281 RepID=A0A836BZZ8_9CHLO|nr:hypothetical protein HYH03_006811 [Edaphochlamys debaryana]|eukprot:KAG2495205.1 hypothetical protein HYH03_006811 [Edaphochlamys debaryana]